MNQPKPQEIELSDDMDKNCQKDFAEISLKTLAMLFSIHLFI